jgi:hypothetical protein
MNPCHKKCPNYQPPKAEHCCSLCGEGIYGDEEYLVNQDGEYRHYDCFYSTYDMLQWLGCEVKTMEEEYE